MGTPTVEVSPYQKSWVDDFAAEAERIRAILGDNCVDIYHIGSTSIPGMSAKPVIDMLPVVKDIAAVDDVQLESIGYNARGELGMMFRRFFHKYDSTVGYHVHMWESGQGEVDKHLLFRKYLINHEDAFQAYESLKLDLATQHKEDRKTYTLGKDDLVKDILKRAGYSGKLIVQALTPNDWAGYHRILNEQIYGPLKMSYNPNSKIFQDPNRFHFVYSLGVDIIGAASIERLDPKRAALRPFAIDTPHQGKGHGLWFLKQIERWLSLQGYTRIVTHAKNSAVGFYEKNGYQTTVFDDKDFSLRSISTDLGKSL